MALDKLKLAKLSKEELIDLNFEEHKVHAKISFGYSSKYILPYEDGLALMKCFAHAETLTDSYNDNAAIVKLKDSPELSIISHEEYAEIKMRALLKGAEKDEEE